MNLLGEIFWGYVHGVVTKLSSKFGWVWTLFARDSWFEGLFAGFLDDTGLSGFEIARPVRPVQCTGQTGLGGLRCGLRSFSCIYFRATTWVFCFEIACP